jgi:ABC-type multidrug transport system ATPase subunit
MEMRPQPSPELELSGIHAGYAHKDVLTGLDMHLEEGLHILLGVNGAGKTTLFRVCAGVVPPREGTVRLGGLDLQRDPVAKRHLAYLAHRPALYPELSVADNLAFWGRTLRLPKQQRAGRIAEVADLVGVGDLLGKRSGGLSRGQAQRVAITKALLGDPTLLLLDEPTTGLDPQTASRIKDLVRTLAEGGRVVVYSTHNLNEAADMADDVLLLVDGKLHGRGTVSELRERVTGDRLVRIRVDGDPREVFERLGLEYHEQGGGWEVPVHGEQETGKLVQALVGDGLTVTEVREVGNPLEAVIRALE